MLDRLDEIDWGSLHHAYGAATDVPHAIRALAEDDATRADALSELFGNIWHQGTVYEASSHAVPFLIELLGPPSTADKVGILSLLASLSTGSSYLDVHARSNADWSRKLRQKPDFPGRLARERTWVKATHDTVEAGIPIYLRLLESTDRELRLAAAHVLGTCTNQRSSVAASLRHAIAAEAETRTRFGLVLCLGGVGGADDVEALRAMASSESDYMPLFDPSPEPPLPSSLCWAAAVALCHIARGDTPPPAIRTLSRTFAAPEPYDDYLLAMTWDHQEAVPTACLALLQVDPALAVPVLVDGLSVVDKSDAMDLTTHLLELTFPEIWQFVAAQPHERRAARDLNSYQRRALSALVSSDEAWNPSWSLASTLRSLGLLDSREELRRFVVCRASLS